MTQERQSTLRLVAGDILASGILTVSIAAFDQGGTEITRTTLATFNAQDFIDLGNDLICIGEQLADDAEHYDHSCGEAPTLEEMLPPLSPSDTQQGGYANGHASKDAA